MKTVTQRLADRIQAAYLTSSQLSGSRFELEKLVEATEQLEYLSKSLASVSGLTSAAVGRLRERLDGVELHEHELAAIVTVAEHLESVFHRLDPDTVASFLDNVDTHAFETALRRLSPQQFERLNQSMDKVKKWKDIGPSPK